MAIRKPKGQKSPITRGQYAAGKRLSAQVPPKVQRKSPMIKPAVIIKKDGKMYAAKPMTLDEYRSPNRKVVPDLSKPIGGRKTLPLPKPNSSKPKTIPMQKSSTRRSAIKKSK